MHPQKEVSEQYEEKMDQAKTVHEEEKADIIAEKELLENKLRMVNSISFFYWRNNIYEA